MEKRLFSKQVILCILFSLACLAPFACEERKHSALSSKSNSPPVIISVTILPEKAYKGTELTLVAQGSDPDNDPITYKYQWIKNGEEMAGENKGALGGDRFRKGDSIQARVTPLDGKSQGAPLLSASVKILDSAPVIQEVRIEPKMPFAGDSLKAQVTASDADGDFVYYTFEWAKDGKAIPDEKGQVLERGRFKKGDPITVTVIPDDREARGSRKQSDPVVILNGPPVITSSPPTSVSGTTYRYPVKAIDPDRDPVAFTLKSGPKGMVIDKEKGFIEWEIRRESKGTYPIEIEAEDSEGAKSTQRYTLTVDFK